MGENIATRIFMTHNIPPYNNTSNLTLHNIRLDRVSVDELAALSNRPVYFHRDTGVAEL